MKINDVILTFKPYSRLTFDISNAVSIAKCTVTNIIVYISDILERSFSSTRFYGPFI